MNEQSHQWKVRRIDPAHSGELSLFQLHLLASFAGGRQCPSTKMIGDLQALRL
jgi:hypothetical protein